MQFLCLYIEAKNLYLVKNSPFYLQVGYADWKGASSPFIRYELVLYRNLTTRIQAGVIIQYVIHGFIHFNQDERFTSRW